MLQLIKFLVEIHVATHHVSLRIHVYLPFNSSQHPSGYHEIFEQDRKGFHVGSQGKSLRGKMQGELGNRVSAKDLWGSWYTPLGKNLHRLYGWDGHGLSGRTWIKFGWGWATHAPRKTWTSSTPPARHHHHVGKWGKKSFWHAPWLHD
jgi:hypothetical protein